MLGYGVKRDAEAAAETPRTRPEAERNLRSVLLIIQRCGSYMKDRTRDDVPIHTLKKENRKMIHK